MRSDTLGDELPVGKRPPHGIQLPLQGLASPADLFLPNRLDNGYRQYSEIDMEQIRMIQLYLSMGLKTNEIADLFHCTWNENKEACIQNGINKGILKLTEIREQIEILRKAESQLMEVVEDLTLDEDVPNGGYFRNRQLITW
jgi:DNA-binding transcriptional MerR regulator